MTNGDIQVQAWTNDQAIPSNSNQPYDWRCTITVPGGGIQPRTDSEDFTAPDNGYQPSNEIDMPASSQQWSPRASQSYFLQLGNGEYARIDFTMAAGGDHFFSITSYLNTPHQGIGI